MKFKLFGTEIYLSFLFFASITAMICVDKTGLILPTFFAVFLHESGHLFMMNITGCAPKKIRLIPASVQIVNSFSKGYKNDLLIAISGPLANLVVFAVFEGFFKVFGNEILRYFSACNLCIGCFNLTPLKGLDGGVILYSFLCKIFGINSAEFTLKVITFFAAFLQLFLAIFMAFYGKINPSFFIMGVYLVAVCFLKA